MRSATTFRAAPLRFHSRRDRRRLHPVDTRSLAPEPRHVLQLEQTARLAFLGLYHRALTCPLPPEPEPEPRWYQRFLARLAKGLLFAFWPRNLLPIIAHHNILILASRAINDKKDKEMNSVYPISALTAHRFTTPCPCLK